jgi:hypothetical protein
MANPYPDLPPIYYERLRPRRPRVPWLRGGFLLLVGAFVVGFLVSADVREATRQVAANAATWAAEAAHIEEPSEPPGPGGVAAEDFRPEHAFAGRSGANVRDYPLPNADLITEVPARAPLNVTGRLNVQGEWWFRVELADARIGFVHESMITWNQPRAAPQPQVAANFSPVEPEAAAVAGRAGAKIRTGPSRSARVIVRVERGAELTVVAKRRIGEHWWYRVRTADGREGYARGDVVTAPGGGALQV